MERGAYWRGALIREGHLFQKSYFLEGRLLESGRLLDHLQYVTSGVREARPESRGCRHVLLSLVLRGLVYFESFLIFQFQTVFRTLVCVGWRISTIGLVNWGWI